MLAWLLARKPWTVPIAGTTKLVRLCENSEAVAIKLTSKDLLDIQSAASKITVQGARYPEHIQKMTGRCTTTGLFERATGTVGTAVAAIHATFQAARDKSSAESLKSC